MASRTKFSDQELAELNQIESVFDESVSAYVANKNRGGRSNQAGNKYENFYAIGQIAKLIQAYLTNGEQTTIKTQHLGFVDDIVIQYQEKHNQDHFQLKDTPSVTWGRGFKSLADDFEKQKTLNDSQGVLDTQLSLVCSNSNNADKLNESIPSSIKDFSQAVFFPSAEQINQLLQIFPDFKESLEAICVNHDPDKLEALSRAILVEWYDSTGQHTIGDIISQLSQRPFSYLRTQEAQIDRQLAIIVEHIQGFSYSLKSGFFFWNYQDNLETGVIPYPVMSTEFNNLQQRIIEQRPTTFDELEAFLS
ncbi:MAG: hypothetical protein HOO93_17130 [Methyloglobulus sp.]|nr:hypothetical protein [Methyloglobulus sp.]